MQTRITSIGKRIPLKLSMSIQPEFGTAVYLTGPPCLLMRQNLAHCRRSYRAAREDWHKILVDC